ncbi:MAG: hypothetical protein P4L03_04405 [Terracidiphilus sp.]|nr:hypothetical protein [Terracidiphilus sp.]
MPVIKKLIWVYFFLLIFEGALRKWVVPQLSAPLLVVRDPVEILIIWEAYRTHRLPRQGALAVGFLCVILIPLAVIQMVVAQTPWFVVLYGLRSYLLPIPVAFILGEVLDRDDLHKFGIWTLYLLIPNVFLEVLQYQGDANSWINAGAGEGAAQIGYVGNHVRASGTFSYVAGPIFFVPLAASFLVYGLTNREFIGNRKILLWACAFAIVLSVPVTGSRSLIYVLCEILLCMALATFSGVSQFGRILKVIFPLICMGILVSFLPVFSAARESMSQRFTSADESEGGTQASFLGRTAMPVINTIADSMERENWIGVGMGYGSNASSKLLTGEIVFLASELEFPRLIDELGAPVGVAFMFFRFYLAIALIISGFRRAGDHDLLAWMLVPVTCSCLMMGIMEQPTETGFFVITLGFSLAALKKPTSGAAIVESAYSSELSAAR